MFALDVLPRRANPSVSTELPGGDREGPGWRWGDPLVVTAECGNPSPPSPSRTPRLDVRAKWHVNTAHPQRHPQRERGTVEPTKFARTNLKPDVGLGPVAIQRAPCWRRGDPLGLAWCPNFGPPKYTQVHQADCRGDEVPEFRLGVRHSVMLAVGRLAAHLYEPVGCPSGINPGGPPGLGTVGNGLATANEAQYVVARPA